MNVNGVMASQWKGSSNTMRTIAHQIAERWGEDAVKDYNPELNCFTFQGWNDRGYRVKKGEKAMRTYTFIPSAEIVKTADGKEEKKWRSYPKNVCLFFIRQVEKRESKAAA